MTPASFGWLLRHELRLAIRGARPGRRWARIVGLTLLATVPVVGGVLGAFALRDAGHATPVTALGYAGVAVAGLVLLMISTAAIAVLRAFHDRHDLDLLLSAPVPPARILAAKAVGVAVSVAMPFMVFTAPFTLASAVLGHPAWLGGLVMVGVAAVVATSLALGLTSILFTALGARRARIVVQLAAAAFGAVAFIAGQLGNLAPALAHRLARGLATRWPPPLDWPARAVFGEPVPLLAMVALAGLSAWGAAGFGARHLAASADAATRRPAARTGPPRFRGGVARTLVAKEWRLIARDPELVAQVGLRLIYVIPLGALILRGGAAGPALATGATAFAGLLASSLAWIVICAEDAPDLIAAAPVAPIAVMRAKLLAACLPPLVLVALPVVVVAGHAPWAASVALAMSGVAATSAALVQAWFGKAQPRAAFRRRQSGSFVVGVGEVALAGAWSGTAALLARGSPWALAPALLGATIMAGALAARHDA